MAHVAGPASETARAQAAAPELVRGARHRGELSRLLGRFCRNRGAMVGAGILGLLVLCALVPGLIAPENPSQVRTTQTLLPPSLEHPFGTDQFGRDILSRVIYSARRSLTMGLLTVLLGGAIGALIGLSAGYVASWPDMLLMRLIDMLMAFPGLILALTIVAALGPGVRNIIIAIAIGFIPNFARIVRGTVISAKEHLYVDAARAVGCSGPRIMFRHILPNVTAPIIVLGTLGVGGAILAGAALSFLGLGGDPSTLDWGVMVNGGREYLGTAWWLTTFPGLAIMVAVLSVNFIGDGVRDALDRRLTM
jgi:peptide/nickel transport system permease protein